MRSDSLYERLKAEGWPMLNEVMSMLGMEDAGARKRTRITQRWLHHQGFKGSSETALTDMRHYCRDLWQYEKCRHEIEELPLPADLDDVAGAKWRRDLLLAKTRAASLEDKFNLARIESDEAKRQINERRTVVAEEKLAMAKYEQQRRGAEFIDATLADVEKMKALQVERNGLVNSGASEAERVDAIRRRVYGDSAVLLASGSTGAPPVASGAPPDALNSNKEAAA